jgi:bifunctional non-homologous end joining protein LigD
LEAKQEQLGTNEEVSTRKPKSGSKLAEYEGKRNFQATPEPVTGTRARRDGRKKAPRFVVQEHSARRLHWDLRLEHGGVAVSWAVPNGIPDDPSENRKAVHTEDHPLEYMSFEGEIPVGEYGAGPVRIWDYGTYECYKWEEGKIVFSFSGERLSGRYALFRAGGERDWLIHRMDPPGEERDPFPEAIEPMLARPGKLPAKETGWAAEVMWKGVRALAYCRPGRLELRDAEGEKLKERRRSLHRLTRQLGSRDAVLDGMVVDLDADHPGAFVIFDLLYLEGEDLTAEPYRRRRELLEGLELSGPSWQTPAYSTGHAKRLLAASAERGLAGLVLKRLDSAYEPGAHSRSWLAVRA